MGLELAGLIGMGQVASFIVAWIVRKRASKREVVSGKASESLVILDTVCIRVFYFQLEELWGRARVVGLFALGLSWAPQSYWQCYAPWIGPCQSILPAPNPSTLGAVRSIDGYANKGSTDSAARSIDGADRSIAYNTQTQSEHRSMQIFALIETEVLTGSLFNPFQNDKF